MVSLYLWILGWVMFSIIVRRRAARVLGFAWPLWVMGYLVLATVEVVADYIYGRSAWFRGE